MYSVCAAISLASPLDSTAFVSSRARRGLVESSLKILQKTPVLFFPICVGKVRVQVFVL